MSMKSSLLLHLGLASIMMSGGTPMYGVPRTRVRERRYPSISGSYRHVAPVPKGCRKETVRLVFKKDDKLANGHLIHVDVDLVYATNKARAKKLRKYQMELGEYIFNRGIGDLQKNEMFIVEPIIKENV